jgi:hypothetical protein
MCFPLFKVQFEPLASLVLPISFAVSVGTVNEDIVHRVRAFPLNLRQDLINSSVGPITKHDSSNIFVVVGACWATDDQAAIDTIIGLKAKVGVIP